MMLNDKVAVVYGAGGAIGGAVARAFASEGARVFVTGRRQARGRNAVNAVVTQVACKVARSHERTLARWPAVRASAAISFAVSW